MTAGLDTSYELQYYDKLHKINKMDDVELRIHTEQTLWRMLLILQEYHKLLIKHGYQTPQPLIEDV